MTGFLSTRRRTKGEKCENVLWVDSARSGSLMMIMIMMMMMMPVKCTVFWGNSSSPESTSRLRMQAEWMSGRVFDSWLIGILFNPEDEARPFEMSPNFLSQYKAYHRRERKLNSSSVSVRLQSMFRYLCNRACRYSNGLSAAELGEEMFL
jgi:hypothetical protein